MLVLILTACAAVEGKVTPKAASTVWDGVYTLDQAERGQDLVDQHCATCHGSNLRGSPGAPAIAGVEFLYGWDGRNLKELLDYMHAAMPPGQPGLLTDASYIDVMATMLRASGFPPAEKAELSPGGEGLEQVKIKREKPG